ncbi:MAG: glycosyltransferase family 4 protein [Moorea sp. SIO2I5]|nr:glycosyltransferase family 4 protein [Moorena sp. SIO2I5]
MRILLDCRFQKGAGPNVATRYLLDELIKLNNEHELIILQHKGQPLPEYPNVKKMFVPFRNPLLELFWIQFWLPLLIKLNSIDICHSLKHIGPLFTNVPTILHVHEVGHFFPEGQEGFQLSLANKIYWTQILVWAMKQATHIIGTSQQCKTVISQKIGIPEDKVSIVPYGVSHKFRPIQDLEVILDCKHRYNLPEQYILCVGNICPQENYDTVVKMLAKLRENCQEFPKLVLVGDTSDAGSEFFELIKQLELSSEIIFTGFVHHNDLVYIYNGATLLLFPPTVAAFGIPPIEAMACGTPVVASNVDAIPEVTAGAALLFNNPRNVDEMLEAISQVIDNHKIREYLKQKGFDRAKNFSWKASALKVLELYKKTGIGDYIRDDNKSRYA